MSAYLDLKAASAECQVGPGVLKAAVQDGALRAKRTSPADPKTNKPAAGKYLFRRADLDAWFDSLDNA